MIDGERVENINIEDEMQRAYIDYSMSVIVGRALPEVRDGMKPGNRRILYAMKERGWTHAKMFVKCAKVVGEVIGNYHPHGDTAVYDTLVRMAQDFSMRYQLIHGQGNFGSIDGDRAAAYRYTECKLQRLAEEMLMDIEKDTVDMRPNFDEQAMEPVVLPARLPNLLLNGSTGIAVGMATNIPPHNLREIVDATVHLIDHPEAEVADLCQFVTGPDFPTGGMVHGLRGIKDFYETGRGRIRLRGIANIETDARGRERIIITEIPYAVNKAAMIEKMAKLVQAKIIDGISDIRDESGKEGIRVVIEIKRNAQADIMLNKIFKHTQMESTFGAIMLAIDHGRPRVMNLKEVLECFIAHRIEVITRRTQFDLNKAEARAHILEGFRIALDHLDEVVRTIRESKDREEAHGMLKARFGFTDEQTKAILDMRLYQLTGLERDKIEAEYDALMKQILYYRELLASRPKLLGVIKDDLAAMRELYGDDRRTVLSVSETEINIEDLIADEPCVITVSHENYIKRVPVGTYRQQRRGGRGVVSMNTKEEDFVEHVFMASTHDYLCCFTEDGIMHMLKVYELPEGNRNAKGKALVNLLQVTGEDKLASMIRIREFTEDQYLVFATASGIIKKTSLSDFRNVRSRGIRAVRVDEGDRLIGVKLTNGENRLMLTTRSGQTVHFTENALRAQGRATRGVIGIRLASDDSVCSLTVVDEKGTLLVVTEHGFGKRTPFDDYRETSRGCRGVTTIRTSERNGKVIGAYCVFEDDALMLVSQSGQLIRISIAEVRVMGRVTQGVRLIRLADGDSLISSTRLDPEEIDDDEDVDGAITVEGSEVIDATEAVDDDADTEEIPYAPEADEEETDSDATGQNE
ncbi:MAG: DNA gyrase subunit A [Spartobacteria bacterium]|nr:DNA gyrase subunit A [Spartobacteria bacterium]